MQQARFFHNKAEKVPIWISALLSALLIFSLTCKESSGDSSDQYTLDVTCTRLNGGPPNPFQVQVNLKKNGAPLAGQFLSVTVDNANHSISSIIDQGDGTYIFTVTPTRTGEYPVTVSYAYGDREITTTRTALAMQGVHTDWGQPMSVPGDVNTDGYEDGVTITPDGEYLFVQTGPYRFSSIFVYNEPRINGGCGGDRLNPDRCNHPWINETCGTYTAPERPGFFDGRFSGTTQLHNAASWGVGIDGAPIYALSTMFYGFKKQSDGTFREPFYMAFHDLNDGIIGPYGLSFRKNGDGTYTIIFTLKDAFTTDAGFDIYTITESLGQNINLGDYELSSPGNPPNRGSYFPSILVDLGDNSGTQGNSYLYYESGGIIKSIWTDDEYDGDADTKDLSVYVLTSGSFPSSGTWTKVVLPTNVNQAGKEAIQPTFAGDGLYFTEDVSVVYTAYAGDHTVSGYGTNANWSTPAVILQKDTSIASFYVNSGDIGKIMAIGEPTIATVNGKRVLYFVYGSIRGIDAITGLADIDMQAGFVERK